MVALCCKVSRLTSGWAPRAGAIPGFSSACPEWSPAFSKGTAIATSAPIAVSSSGDNTIVAGVTGYAVRVLGYVLAFSGTVNAEWMSGTGGGATALSGLLYGVANSGVCAPVVEENARGWFQTASGQGLNLNLSGAVAVGGHVLYELVAT
jgi:hypothetical protein